MKKEGILIIIACLLAGFLIGLLIGRDSTTLSFRGLPEDTVIHFEINKGAVQG